MAAKRGPEPPVPVQSIADVVVGSLVIVEGGKTETARRGVVRFVGSTQVCRVVSRGARAAGTGRT